MKSDQKHLYIDIIHHVIVKIIYREKFLDGRDLNTQIKEKKRCSYPTGKIKSGTIQ